MSHRVLSIALAALAGTSAAVGFANDFQGVGTCPAGGTMSIVTTGPYKGRAFDLKKYELFRAKYSELLGDSEHWSASLIGPSSENRRYVNGKGSRIVFTSCQPRNCAPAQLYGVVDDRSGAIGVWITENGKEAVKGTLTEEGKAVIACAKLLDAQAAKRAEDSLKGEQK
jgi:hypothetical protein